ncbi:MAG: ATP-binding cassette domain-containing protein [Bacteroidales bacterium]|nr:ATP-binding cassette domain-containing protein [Bacteroidales bacterium]
MIKVENLAFSYGSAPVLQNVNLTLEPGKIYGLLGENGVGKTTLLTLLCGLKKARQGTVLSDGFIPYDRLPEFLQNQYFLPDEVAPVNSVAETWAKDCGKFWPGYDHSVFLELLSLFEVNPSLKMNAMSAGQLKKSYISFALACRPSYLFLDEPTNGLDIPSKAQFRSAVMKYTSEDSTIVISTHQVRDLENIIDPIIILDRQDVLLNASMEEIQEKLFFDYGTTLHPESLYSEQLPGGFIQVYLNQGALVSKVNIEALFNAAHSHKELIKGIFSK